MADPKLGTKRIDPETGRKFYDLGKDPIVSPYTGTSYPRSYFDAGTASVRDDEEEAEEREAEAEEAGADVVSLEEADEEGKGADDLPDLGEEDDVELGDDAEDTFLEDEEEEGDDVSGILGVGDDDES